MKQVAAWLTEQWAIIYDFSQRTQHDLSRDTLRHPFRQQSLPADTFTMWQGLVMRFYEQKLHAAYAEIQEKVIQPLEKREKMDLMPKGRMPLVKYRIGKLSRKAVFPAITLTIVGGMAYLVSLLFGLIRGSSAISGLVSGMLPAAGSLVFWLIMLGIIITFIASVTLWKAYGERLEVVSASKDHRDFNSYRQPVERSLDRKAFVGYFQAAGKDLFGQIVKIFGYLSLLSTVATLILGVLSTHLPLFAVMVFAALALNIIRFILTASYIYTKGRT